MVCNKSTTMSTTSGAITATLPEHLNLHPVFGVVRTSRQFVFYVVFVDHYLSLCHFWFGHCIVCPSSLCILWLPLWYFQIFLILLMRNVHLIFTERNLIVILLYISVMMMLIKQEETITKRASLWPYRTAKKLENIHFEVIVFLEYS